MASGLNEQQLQKMKTHPGFIAALDQSGGSTPNALRYYGIQEGAWSTEDEMFAIVHQMRTRIITSPSFTGERILAAILFENTMDRDIAGQPTADYLWNVKRVVPFVKVDQGLAAEQDGVQLMRPMPALAALLAIVVLWRVGGWYGRRRASAAGAAAVRGPTRTPVPVGQVRVALAVLIVLVFSKYIYLASLTSYYTFYLIHRFGVSVQTAQLHLFWFLGAVAAGTIIGGPVGDRIGRKRVIWASILGVLPFTLALPYVGLMWSGVLSVIIGVVIASAFSAILVYAQELLPGRVGMISGLFFGLAFGIAGIGAAVLGRLADATSITFVYHVCAFLPAIGLLAAFLPETAPAMPRKKEEGEPVEFR